jgi:hypothetical protein
LRSSFAALTGRASWSLRARFTLRSLRPDRSLRTCWTSFTALANATLRPDRPLLSLRTLRSARANGPWRAGLAYGARRTLGPSRRVTASRESEHRHDSGDDQVSVHWQDPRGRSADCAEPSNAVKTLQVALSGP